MTINPLEIPCAYCGRSPVVPPEWPTLIYCPDCEQAITAEEWITGGINAMAGELTKRHIHFSFTKTPNRNYWSCWQEDSSVVNGGWLSFGGRFDTFEEAVLDAWEALKKEGK